MIGLQNNKHAMKRDILNTRLLLELLSQYKEEKTSVNAKICLSSIHLHARRDSIFLMKSKIQSIVSARKKISFGTATSGKNYAVTVKCNRKM